MNHKPIALLTAALFAVTLSAAGSVKEENPHSAELGSVDFLPTPQRPIGWRGDGTGWFPGAKGVVTGFDGTTGSNILWTARMPGVGQASPVVFGGRVYVTVEDDQLLCLDAEDGKTLWTAKAGLPPRPEKTDDPGTVRFHSWVMATPVSDGKHVVAKFGLGGLLCVDLDGKVLWKAEVPVTWKATGVLSPLIADGRVIVHVPLEGGAEADANSKRWKGELRAYDVETGRELWRSESQMNDASTPGVVRVGTNTMIVTGRGAVHRVADGFQLLPPNKQFPKGKDRLGIAGESASVLTGGDCLYLYTTDPRENTKIGKFRLAFGADGSFGFTKLWDGTFVHRMHATSGRTDAEVFAVGCFGDFVAMDEATGKGRFFNVLTRKEELTYPYDTGLPEMPLTKLKAAYAQAYNGNKAFGQELWSSPVAADGHVFMFSQHGGMICLRLQPKLEVVGTGVFDKDSGSLKGASMCSTPFFYGNRMYIRTPTAMVCVGPKPAARKE